MKAQDLQDYLYSLKGTWEYPPDTVDTFKSGDPQTEVTGIAVGWMSYTWALEKALALGCNVFVTHEPTYFNHRDNDEAVFRFAHVAAKRAFIEQSGLVIIRCHDLWDQIEGIGIPDSWGAFLGFERPLDGVRFLRVYDVAGKTALQVAQQVASHTQALGQEAVQLIGDPQRPVTRLALGTGAITPYRRYIEELNADIALCSDDGIQYWQDGAFAQEADLPLIVVNHPVSEEAGVISLANHLRAQFPAVPVQHIPQRCMVQLVTADNTD